MADVDAEVVERVARWCAEAGRQAGAVEIRRALAPLTWDELLAVKALLADPPPARPLGPSALADIARGTLPDLAAEREREGRYRAEEEAEPPTSTPTPRRGRKKAAPILIRRARDRAPAAPPAPPAPPSVEELRRPEGRAVLERLVRRHGARRGALAAVLAAGWRRPDGSAPGDEDLSALLDHHGLARAFERRERDEILHALRAAGGVRPAAAERLGVTVDALAAALARLGATADAERIREQRRAELRGRATLAERARLLVAEAGRLEDLGLLDEFERDLRARLPEHLRALRAGREPLAAGLARSLSVARGAAEALAARFGLELAAPARPRAAEGHREERPARRTGERRPRARGASAGGRPRTREGGRRGTPSRPGRAHGRPKRGR